MKFMAPNSSKSPIVCVSVLLDYQHPILLQAFLSVIFPRSFVSIWEEEGLETMENLKADA